MGTKEFVRVLFHFYALLQTFPVRIKWSEDGLLEPIRDVTIGGFYLNQFVTFLQLPLFLYGLSIKWNDYVAHGQYFHLTFHSIWISCVFCCTSFQWVFFTTRNEIIALVNQSIRLRKHFEWRQFSIESYNADRKYEYVLLSLYGFLFVSDMSTVIMPLFITFHQEAWYLTAYILKPLYEDARTHGSAMAIAFIFEFWWASTQFGALALQAYIHIVYLRTMTTSLKQISEMVSGKRRRMRDDEGTLIRTAMSSYKKLRILSTMYNRSLGKSFLPYFKTTLGVCCVGALFLSIKSFFFGNATVIGFGCMCVCCVGGNLVVITKLCAQLNKMSVQLEQELTARRFSGKLARTYIRSYKQVGVEVGNFYLVQRITPLTMLAIVGSVATNLLISVQFRV